VHQLKVNRKCFQRKEKIGAKTFGYFWSSKVSKKEKSWISPERLERDGDQIKSLLFFELKFSQTGLHQNPQIKVFF